MKKVSSYKCYQLSKIKKVRKEIWMEKAEKDMVTPWCEHEMHVNKKGGHLYHRVINGEFKMNGGQCFNHCHNM